MAVAIVGAEEIRRKFAGGSLARETKVPCFLVPSVVQICPAQLRLALFSGVPAGVKSVSYERHTAVCRTKVTGAVTHMR